MRKTNVMVILMLGYFKTPPGRRIHARVMWIIGAAAILFACLVFTLTAPLYVWDIVGV